MNSNTDFGFYMELVSLMNESDTQAEKMKTEAVLSEAVVIKSMLDNHGFGLEKAKVELAKYDINKLSLEEALLKIIEKQKEQADEDEKSDDIDDHTSNGSRRLTNTNRKSTKYLSQHSSARNNMGTICVSKWPRKTLFFLVCIWIAICLFQVWQ